VGHEIGENSDRDSTASACASTTALPDLSQADIGRLRVGDSVRIENGRAFRY
jgi:hypothetical protein